MNRFQRVWNRLAAPCATDPDDARHEHMTRVILLMQAAALTVFTIPIVVGWIAGAFPLEAAIIMLSLLVPTIAGFWWAHHGRWQTARHIPPILFAALALYLSFTAPLGLTPLLLLILAIMLTSMLHGSRTYWLVLGFTLAAYVAIGISSSQESAQWIIEALIIIGGSIAGLALLQWFSTSQFRNAIHNLQTEIADRKQAEDALRKSEEKFRTFAELLPEVVFECDVQGNLSFVNESAFDKFGYTREDFENGVNAGQFIAPRDRERMAKDIEKALRGVGEDSAEYVAQRRDDSKFPVIVFSSPIVHDGKPVGLRGIIVDITERKQAQEESQEKNRTLATLLDVSQALHASLDTDVVNQTIIENAVRLVGLDTGAIYELDGQELVLSATTPPLPPDFPNELRQAILTDHPYIRQAASTRSPIVVENTATADLSPAERAVAEMRSLQSILYLPLSDGKIVLGVMILGTQNETRSFSEAEINLYRTFAGQAALNLKNAMLYRDVQTELAERRKVEKTLQIERDNFRNILGAMKDGVYIVNREFDIQYVNPAFAEKLGSYENKKCYAYFHNRTEVCPWCKNLDVFAGETVRWEWHSLENRKTYDVIDTPLKNPDGSISKLELSRDITGRKQAERRRWNRWGGWPVEWLMTSTTCWA